TLPSTNANSVQSRPVPTLLPAMKRVPRCRTRMLPAVTNSPPYRFTPRRLLTLSRPLRTLPCPFLCAISYSYNLISLIFMRVNSCRCPIVLWYPLRRFILNVVFFSPRRCSTTSARIEAFAIVGLPTLNWPSLATKSTLFNTSDLPASASNRSTSSVSPGATRYCFPPVSITAYIKSPLLNPNLIPKGRRYHQKPSMVSTFLTLFLHVP